MIFDAGLKGGPAIYHATLVQPSPDYSPQAETALGPWINLLVTKAPIPVAPVGSPNPIAEALLLARGWFCTTWHKASWPGLARETGKGGRGGKEVEARILGGGLDSLWVHQGLLLPA